MMKVRSLHIVGVICMVAAMSGCVSYGNTHALVTPVGAVGYHTFKPQNSEPAVPSESNPNRVAATNAQNDDVET